MDEITCTKTCVYVIKIAMLPVSYSCVCIFYFASYLTTRNKVIVT